MKRFITENKGLIGVIAVCATYIFGRVILAKHYEKVNDQRIRMYELTKDDTIRG